MVVETTEFFCDFHAVLEAEVALLEGLVYLLENIKSLFVSGISLEDSALDNQLQLFVQLRDIELVDLIIDDICKLNSD